MKRFAIAATLLVLSAPALADEEAATDQRAADQCIAAWGAKSPFKKGKRPDTVLGTGVKVFGIGKNQVNDAVTDKPALIVVRPTVNVAGRATLRLGNPNGWYCLRNQTTVAGKIAINAHCKAQVAHSTDGGTAVMASDDTDKGTAVMGVLRIQRFGC